MPDVDAPRSASFHAAAESYLDAAVLAKWQDVIDTLAELLDTSAGLIIRVTDGNARVLVASRTVGNPYRAGDALTNPNTKLEAPLLWPDQRPFGAICIPEAEGRCYPDVFTRLVELCRDSVERDLARIYADKHPAEGRQHADETLRSSEERFRLLVEHAGEAFYLHGVNGRLLDVNRQACEGTGYTRDELLRMQVTDLSVDLDPAVSEDGWVHAEPGESVMVLGRHRRKDGTLFPVEVRRTCYIIRGEKLFFKIARDITQRVAAQGAIDRLHTELEQRVMERTAQWQRSAALLQAVMDGAADAIYLKDRDGRFLLFNRAASRVAGVPAEAVLGKTISDFFDEEASARIRHVELQVMATGETSTVEETIRTNGVLRTFLATRSPHRDDQGAIIGLISIAREITETRRIELELRESQARWQFAVDGTGDGIWDWNVQTGWVFYSRQWKAMLGYAKDEIGHTVAEWSDRVHPDDMPRCWAAIQDHLQGNSPDFILEHRMRAKDGSWHWILDRGKVIERAADGQPLRVIGTHTDITARKQVEEQVAARERWLSEMVENLPIGAAFVTGEQIRINRAIEELTGYKREDLSGRDAWFHRMWQGMYERLMPIYLEDRANGFGRLAQVPFYRADGQLRLAEFAAALVGEHEIWLMRDITDSKDLQAQVASLTDNLPNGTVYRMIEARDGGISFPYVSAGVNDLLGIAAADIMDDPKALWRTVLDEDKPAYIAAADKARTSEEAFDCQLRHHRRDGRIVWVHSRAALHQRLDGATVWDGVAQDITAERQAAEALQQAKEAAEAAERSKSEFLAVMSHEIRTPMNTVLGMSRLALKTDLAPRQRNYLGKINTAAQTLTSIISDILDFSKIEAGKLELEEAEYSLESVLESVSAVTSMRAEEKGLEIAYAVARDVPDRWIGDSLRLGQVLINLVNNAVKFTHEGEIVVSISMAQDAAMLQFTVRDTGIGLSPGQIAGLFRAFSQADSQVTRKYGGTGLGLAICKQLVELMGGRIWVTSEPGKGSAFCFTAAARPAPGTRARSPARQLPELNGRRVLIVDDNASARDILVHMVRRFGMDAQAAESGTAALAALKQASQQNRPFELVLMDWRMPGMDGLDTAQQIRTDLDLRHTPAVLMVTAYGREEVLRRAEAIGLQGVLIKPVTGSVMFNTIVDILEATHAGNQIAAPRLEAGAALPREAWLAPLAGRRILLVDDNALNREVVGDFLTEAGMLFETAANGRQALARLEAGQYDAVLMDMHMPEMDGLTAGREIRCQARWAALPIIALTAQARVEDRNASLAAGMNAHLTKPIDETVLYRTLLQLLPDTPPADRTPDLAAALDRLGGNPGRLLRLLRGFVRDYTAVPAQVTADHQAGKTDAIAALAHRTKGTASYLDAAALCSVAGRLEHAARQGDTDTVDAQVPVFCEHLEAVLRYLNEQLAQSPGVAAAGAIDHPAVLRLIAQAEPLVLRADYAAQAMLDWIGAQLEGTSAAAHVEAVRLAYEDLELETAHAALLQLKAELAQRRGEERPR